VALTFAAILAAAAVHAGPTIVPGDWYFLGNTSDRMTEYFTRAAAPGSSPRIWVRSEALSATYPASTATLFEMNCQQLQYRMLSSTNYAQHNLGGATNSLPQTYAWEYAIPSSIGEAMVNRACGLETPSN
jgi:hypothetical protein